MIAPEINNIDGIPLHLLQDRDGIGVMNSDDYNGAYYEGELYSGIAYTTWDNGITCRIEYLKNGIANGPFVVYRENGSIAFKGQTQNGSSEGEIIYYDWEGGVRMIETHREGIAIDCKGKDCK